MAKSIKARSADNASAGEKNGNARLLIIADAVAGYMGSDGSDGGDWTNLAWNICHQQNKTDRELVTAIITAVTGLRFRDDAKQPTGLRAVKSKDSEVTNKYGLLVSYYESGVSFRSDALRDDWGLPALLEEKATEPKVRTVEEVILAAVRKVKRDCGEGATKARIIMALNTALEAEYK